MKKFLACIVGIILVGVSTTVATLGIMAKVHNNTMKQEWQSWTKQEETIVVEQPNDEIQEELPSEETPEQTEEPASGDKGASTEDETSIET